MSDIRGTDEHQSLILEYKAGLYTAFNFIPNILFTGVYSGVKNMALSYPYLSIRHIIVKVQITVCLHLELLPPPISCRGANWIKLDLE